MYAQIDKLKQKIESSIYKKKDCTERDVFSPDSMTRGMRLNGGPSFPIQLNHKKQGSKTASNKQKHQKGERQLQMSQIRARFRQLYNSDFSNNPFCRNWVSKNRALYGENYSQWTRQKM
ncbi:MULTISPECIES: hypothetical protein [unclassified Pseudoalteromonas]|uniref:hypothetical protein n=1 Tax=unclassified Pseudoalteromonas TaxID=194690 RepID=UPI002096E511|nr:hypothetical protein [Pseudoalteromonas sp. XMcav2-N]MCO7189551.1 hypothetical protein [Pseudoalteromonas sp. XMcav2-N]